MKKDLLLLHGALGCSEQLDELSSRLKNDFNVFTITFSGHGKNASAKTVFAIENFCDDILRFLAEHQMQRVNIFGYSMGGYVALYLAKNYPEKVNGIFTLATKFNWNPESAKKETAMLDPVMMEKKIPAFTKMLAERHGEETWKTVVNKTAEMMLAMGNENPLTAQGFSQIKCRVMLGLGDQDKMVSREETEAIHLLIPESEICILPDTLHPLEKVNQEMLAGLVKIFFNNC